MTAPRPPAPGRATMAVTATTPPSGVVYVGPSLGRSLVALAAAVVTGRRP